MSDKQDEKLDAMLRARRFEPASRDLAQRIILKAQSLPQNQTLPLSAVDEAVVRRVPSAQTCLRSRKRAGFGNDCRLQHAGQDSFEG